LPARKIIVHFDGLSNVWATSGHVAEKRLSK
jgi:hypothetical protein